MGDRYTIKFDDNPRYKRTSHRYGVQDDIFASSSIIQPLRSTRVETREIDTTPFKILDSPGLLDDYYLNLLDWSNENIISICLGETLYNYSYNDGSVSEIISLEAGYLSSVKSEAGKLAVGTSEGSLHIYDQLRGTQVFRNENQHRISSLEWAENVISLGMKNGVIRHYDIRSNKLIKDVKLHSQEICGLKWSPNKQFLASGGNDNLVQITQIGLNSIYCSFARHQGAVKAMDWCPWRNSILVTGGGTKDKTIRFWDITDRKEEKVINVDSQVCSLKFIGKYKELITGHGYSENDIRIWKANQMKMMKSFGKHESRVLHLAVSPDENVVASISADENLKFWNIAKNEPIIIKRDSVDFR